MNLQRKIGREIILYGIVGGLGAILDFLVFGLLIHRGVSVGIAQLSAGCVGFAHNHLFQHFLIFTHRRRFSTTLHLSLVIALAVIVLSVSLLTIVQQIIGNLWVSKIVVMVVSALGLFIIRRRWIFSDRSCDEHRNGRM